MSILAYILISAGALAAGWFANIISQRLPNEKLSLFGPLHCVRSGELLHWYDSFPIFGFIAQRGSCRYCHKPLPRRFLVLEVLILVSLLVAWPLYTDQPLAAYLFNAFAIVLLITIAMIDWRLRLIFPIMIYLGLFLALLAALLVPGSQFTDRIPNSWLSMLGGAIFGTVFFLGIYWLALAIYRVRALGFGDVLLAMLIGAQNGFPRAVTTLFLGAIVGGIAALVIYIGGFKKSREFIPYGTWMCVGAVLVLVFGETVWRFGPLQTLTGLFDLLSMIIFNSLNRLFGS